MSNHIHLKINIICLIVAGILILNLKGKLKFLNKIHKCYSWIILIYFVTFVITELIECFRIIRGDLFELVANLGVSLLYSGCIIKIMVCRSSSLNALIHQIYETESRIFESDNEFVKKIYLNNAQVNYFVNKLLIVVGVVTIAPFYFNPLLVEWQNPPGSLYELVDNSTIIYTPRPLPFSSWFPFDRYKYYYLSYACHIIAGTFGATLTVTTDIMFYGLIIYGVGQIKILQHYLEEFKMYSEVYAKLHPEINVDQAVEIFVGKCVQLHNVIIKYVKDLDTSMRWLMLIDFALASMQMAMLGFQIIVTGFGLQQLFALEYLVAMLVQLFLFYWYANEILIESTKISVAIYNSEWFDCKPRIRRSFIFMMMRSSKPLTLSVGPFYAMSTSTGLGILRAAYSYVALLRQTYIHKET